MNARHRARRNSVQILSHTELAAKDCRRPQTKTFHDNAISFPFLSRRRNPSNKALRSKFIARRPTTVQL